MTEKYKILASFIKDSSSETPDVETYFFVKDNISKYKLKIDIKTKPLKNKLLEIDITFTYFPDVHFLKPNYPRAKVWENFINKVNYNDIKIYDPWDYFLANTNKSNLSWSLVDKHADCEANQIMANYLETIL